MNMHDLPQNQYLCRTKHISWTAIFIGALVAMGLGFLLNLFGLAIGLSAFSLNGAGAAVLTIGGAVGILIGVIASMITAGYTAGYLGRMHCYHHKLGILYGFATWWMALLLSAVLAAHTSNYLVNYTANITNRPAMTSTASLNNSNATSTFAMSNASATDRNYGSPENMAWAAFAVFILFFVGAASTCVGACWGMGCNKEKDCTL